MLKTNQVFKPKKCVLAPTDKTNLFDGTSHFTNMKRAKEHKERCSLKKTDNKF